MMMMLCRKLMRQYSVYNCVFKNPLVIHWPDDSSSSSESLFGLQVSKKSIGFTFQSSVGRSVTRQFYGGSFNSTTIRWTLTRVGYPPPACTPTEPSKFVHLLASSTGEAKRPGDSLTTIIFNKNCCCHEYVEQRRRRRRGGGVHRRRRRWLN